LLLSTGIVEELLNVIVNQVHPDDTYFGCAAALALGSSAAFRSRLQTYVKHTQHLATLRLKPEMFITDLLADKEAIRYVQLGRRIVREREEGALSTVASFWARERKVLLLPTLSCWAACSTGRCSGLARKGRPVGAVRWAA
jgi:hypothetical protein